MDSNAPMQAATGKFQYSEVVARARSLIKGSKRIAFPFFLAFMVAAVIFGFVIPDDGRMPLWAELIGALLAAPIGILSANFGLQRAAGQDVTFRSLFQHIDRLPRYLILVLPAFVIGWIATAALGSAGEALTTIALYPLFLATYFIIDRDAGAWQALAGAYRLVLNNLGQFLVLALLFIGLVFLCALTLGVAGIWVIPFALILYGVVYAEAEGLTGEYGSV